MNLGIINLLADEEYLNRPQLNCSQTSGQYKHFQSHTCISEGTTLLSSQSRVSILLFRCKEAFYTSSSSLSKRKSGIGFGKRSDFTHNTIVSPGSPTYKHRGQFDKLGMTFSFSIGREKSPERHYAYHVGKAKVPGPGAVIILLFSIKVKDLHSVTLATLIVLKQSM